MGTNAAYDVMLDDVDFDESVFELVWPAVCLVACSPCRSESDALVCCEASCGGDCSRERSACPLPPCSRS